MSASPVYSPERGVGKNQFELHTVTRRWDDADLLTGRVIWTPGSPGDICYTALSWIVLSELWDGTTPRLVIGSQSDLLNERIAVNTADLAVNLTNGSLLQELRDLASATVGWRTVTTDPIVVVVDDGAEGAVGGTTGLCEVNLVTANPLDFVVAE